MPSSPPQPYPSGEPPPVRARKKSYVTLYVASLILGITTGTCAPGAHLAWAQVSPANAADAASDEEILDDPEDMVPIPAATPKPAEEKRAGPVESPVHFSAGLLSWVTMDFVHDGPDVGVYMEDVMELRGRASGSMHYKPTSWLRLKLSTELLYRLTMNRSAEDASYWGAVNRNEVEPRIQDSFAELTTSWLDFGLGMMTTVWGLNTLVNPNDVLTARDFRDGPPIDPEAMRVAAPTVRTSVFTGGWTLSAVWMPGFFPDKVDVFGSDYAFFGAGAPGQLGKIGATLSSLVDNSMEGQLQEPLRQTQMPRPINGSVLGLRLSHTISGWDLALQYTYNLTRTAAYRVSTDMVAALMPILSRPDMSLSAEERMALGQMLTMSDDIPIEATYRRYNQLGLSVSKVLWKLVANLDISYCHRRPLQLGGDAPLIMEGEAFTTVVDSQILASTLGMQYTFGEEIYLNVEGWYELQLDIAQQTKRPSLLLGGPHRSGVALLARYLWNRLNLTMELTAYTEFFYPGLVLAPKLTYRIGDHFRVFIGANIFSGSERSTGGIFGPNDHGIFGVEGLL